MYKSTNLKLGCLKLTYQNNNLEVTKNYLKKELTSKRSLDKGYSKYPFGMSMPGRSFSPKEYRFNFQGQETEQELWGGEASFFKYRISDNRLGRFFSVDPLARDYAWNSTYAFSENRVIDAVELEGLEKIDYKYRMNKDGRAVISKINVDITKPYSANYFLTGRKTSWLTIQKINGVRENDPLVQKGIDKIRTDSKAYNGNFPDNYYVQFGSFLFNNAIPSIQEIESDKNSGSAIKNGIDKVTGFLDNTTSFGNGVGSPLYHMYENMVRKNDDTGYDKLLHFSFTAKYAYFGVGLFMGEMKEFVKDEVFSWFSNDIGWDDNDIKANYEGNKYMLKLLKNVGTKDPKSLSNSSLFKNYTMKGRTK